MFIFGKTTILNKKTRIEKTVFRKK